MTAPLSENDPTSQPPQRTSLAKSHPVLLMVTIGLGIAIIVVLALMVGLVVRRASVKPANPEAVAAIPVPVVPAVKAPQTTVSTTIVVRKGTALAEARFDDGVLVLRTVGGDADEVITMDPKTGHVLTRITLKKSDAP